MYSHLNMQTPLKNNWEKLMRPVVDQLKLLIRFNKKTNCVELKVWLLCLCLLCRLLLTLWTAVVCRREKTTSMRLCWVSTLQTQWLCFVWTICTLVVAFTSIHVQKPSKSRTFVCFMATTSVERSVELRDRWPQNRFVRDRWARPSLRLKTLRAAESC